MEDCIFGEEGSSPASSTITVSLSEFSGNTVNLAEAKWFRIKFPASGNGKMFIDSIEFIK